MDPQQEWSDYYQRLLQTHWSADYQRYYWKHYVEGQGWVFLEWCPQTTQHHRGDSFGPWTGHATPANSRKYRGQTVQGTYNFANPQPDSHYEKLDASYYVRVKSFFTEGKVFSVLFTEAAGTTVTGYNNAFSVLQPPTNDALSIVKYKELAHTQIRRFIVVRSKREFCFAIPIFTYGGQGTNKSGVIAKEHAIAYSYGYQATLLQGEIGITKDPICVVMKEGERPLSTASRIYFGIHHPIQYNVKVKELGYVHPHHLINLKKYWAMENQDDTEQDAQVTAEAATESPAPYTGGFQQQQQNDEESYQDDNNDDQTGHNPHFAG